MSVATRLSAEEYLHLAPTDQNTELVRGDIVAMNPGGFQHGEVGVRVGRLLSTFTEEKVVGRVSGHDVMILTARDPDTVRGADVAFYTSEQVAADAEIRGIAPPPLVVFEIRSPNDRRGEIITKAGEYLSVGVQVVIVLDPATRTANVFTSEAPVALIHEDEILPLPPPLEELRLTVGQWVRRPARASD